MSSPVMAMTRAADRSALLSWIAQSASSVNPLWRLDRFQDVHLCVEEVSKSGLVASLLSGQFV